MRRRFSISVLVGLVLVLGCGFAMQAQTEGARLQVQTVGGASTFRMGERIPIELAFSAPPKAECALLMATYDRSGRMRYESFEVSPASGASDPLAAYFDGGSFMSGGFSSLPEKLSKKPVTIRLDMNEWVRFDSPGDYTVRVRSARVIGTKRARPEDQPGPVESNLLTLHIVAASPEWQQAKLAALLPVLATKRSPYAEVPPEIVAAVADLRYLASPEAVPVLVQGLGEDQRYRNGSSVFGLIGLPSRLQGLARRLLREQLENPNLAVTGPVMEAISVLTALPAVALEGASKAKQTARKEVLQLTLAALLRKTEAARTASADLLLRQYTGSLTREQQAVVAQALGANFSRLPEEDQAALLDTQWDLLRSAISTQVLATAVSLPVHDLGNREVENFERLNLKSDALRRWYEIDPTAATEAAYRQIGSASPSLDAGRLWFLPSEHLPHFEALWAPALLTPAPGAAKPEVLAELMVRFGTGQFASQVAAKVRTGLDAAECAPQAAMVSYVLKFNPELGGPLLRDALNARKTTGCYRTLLHGTEGYAAGPMMSEVAMEALGDSQPEVAAEAISYLATYGDERAKRPILTRYRAWTEAWSGRADELQSTVFNVSPHLGENALGEALGRALLAGQGWMTDAALRAEVLRRCVGPQLCSDLKQLAAESAEPYRVSLFQSGAMRSIHMGPYQIPDLNLLKAKLVQFPEGSVFRLTTTDDSFDGRAFERQVRAVFEAAGMTLTKAPRPQPE